MTGMSTSNVGADFTARSRVLRALLPVEEAFPPAVRRLPRTRELFLAARGVFFERALLVAIGGRALLRADFFAADFFAPLVFEATFAAVVAAFFFAAFFFGALSFFFVGMTYLRLEGMHASCPRRCDVRSTASPQ